MKTSKNCTFLIHDAAHELAHPMVNTSVKLWKFLKQYGIVVNNTPDPVLVAKGFFAIEFRRTMVSGSLKNYAVVLVSQAGIQFIKRLAKLIYG